MVDGTGLENQRGATHREFESRPLRHRKYSPFGLYFLCVGSRLELAGAGEPARPRVWCNAAKCWKSLLLLA